MRRTCVQPPFGRKLIRGRRSTSSCSMRPRNTKAILATSLALLMTAGFASSADGGTAGLSQRGCAKASGNCSGKHLDGRHYMAMSLTRSRWNNASLFLASFRFTDLYKAKFRGATLRRADLRNGNRTRADFRKADMTRVNVSHSNFYGSNLRGAKLQGAVVIGANFDKTNLFFADFTGAFMKGTSFNNVRLCHTIQPNGTERNDNCKGSGGGGGKGPSGGDCCFPGDKGQGNGGTDQNKGDGDEPIVGVL